jgi:hypothetical protein
MTLNPNFGYFSGVGFGIAPNGLQIGDVKALQNVSILVECWWLLYCLCAVIGCPSFGININNLK